MGKIKKHTWLIHSNKLKQKRRKEGMYKYKKEHEMKERKENGQIQKGRRNEGKEELTNIERDTI